MTRVKVLSMMTSRTLAVLVCFLHQLIFHELVLLASPLYINTYKYTVSIKLNLMLLSIGD